MLLKYNYEGFVTIAVADFAVAVSQHTIALCQRTHMDELCLQHLKPLVTDATLNTIFVVKNLISFKVLKMNSNFPIKTEHIAI